MLLTLLLLIPITGVFAISTDMSYDLSFRNIRRIKTIALTTSIINLIVSLVTFVLFDFSSNQFQFVQEYLEISFFDFYLELGGLSIYFVLLTTIITPIALLSNWNLYNENVRSFVIIILLLESILLAVLLLNLPFIYVLGMVPLFILIGLFGSSNKVRVSYFLTFCTIFMLSYYILPYVDAIGLMRVSGVCLIGFVYKYHRFYMPIHIALYYRLNLFMDNKLLVYLYNWYISKKHPHTKNQLLAMPFVQSLLPEFTAAGAIVILSAALNLVEGRLHEIEALSGAERLSSLQEIQSRLISVAKDQCAEANAKVSQVNNRAYNDDPTYLAWKAEARIYYDSAEYSRQVEVNKDLSRRIIELHREGITNQDSFNSNGRLRLRVTDFKSTYQQAYRFNSFYD